MESLLRSPGSVFTLRFELSRLREPFNIAGYLPVDGDYPHATRRFHRKRADNHKAIINYRRHRYADLSSIITRREGPAYTLVRAEIRAERARV